MIKLFFYGLLLLYAFSQKQYSIAIIADDFHDGNRRSRELLREEINSILGKRGEVVFKDKYLLQSDWSNETINQHYQTLLKANDVDLILVTGAYSVAYISSQTNFSKPVILVAFFGSEAHRLPYIDGHSGVKNLTYVRFADRLVERLKQFHKIYPFKRLGFIYDKRMVPFINIDRSEINLFFASKNASYKIIEFDLRSSSDTQLKDIDAVYVGDLRWLDIADKKAMYESINHSKIPSFTPNLLDLSLGAFASTTSSEVIPKIIRRLALLVESAFSGENLALLDVDIEFELEYQINIATIRAINISPPYDILIEAKLHGLEDIKIDVLSLKQIIQQALTKNLNFQAIKLDVTKQEIEIEQSKSSQ